MNTRATLIAFAVRLTGVIASLGLLLVTATIGTGCARRIGTPMRPIVSVMTYNIHHGEGVDGQVDLERIAALINEHQPGLVALQEVDRGTARTQRRDLPAELARLTGLQVVFGKNIDFQGGEYGNAILSRYPILSWTNRHYHMLRDGEQRGLLQATVRHLDRELVFMATHLDYRPDATERLSNVAEIRAAVAAHVGKPVIVAGDFNDHPGREVHRAMKEQFLDVWEQAGAGDGFTSSSTQPKSRIDYLWLTPTNRWTIEAVKVLTSQASDHLPVLVELRRDH